MFVPRDGTRELLVPRPRWGLVRFIPALFGLPGAEILVLIPGRWGTVRFTSALLGLGGTDFGTGRWGAGYGASLIDVAEDSDYLNGYSSCA